jgi:hypothetical protein
MKAFAFRSPESTKLASPPVSRDETGPSHGPRSHEIASDPYPKAQPGRSSPDHAFWTRDPRTIPRVRGCPRARAIVTAQVARVSKPIPSLRLPEAPSSTAVPRVACTMKPSSPLQFPETTPATSLHGAPVRWPRCSARFPKPIIDAGARCSSISAYVAPGFPNVPSTAKRFPARQILAAPLSFPSGATPSGPTGHPCTSSSASSLRLPGSTVRALRHGLLELHDAGDLSPSFPSVDHQPHCARSEHEDDVFTRFPGCSRSPRCTAAHALEAPTPRSCPRGVFPRHAVACVSSGVAVRSSSRPVSRASERRQR